MLSTESESYNDRYMTIVLAINNIHLYWEIIKMYYN